MSNRLLRVLGSVATVAVGVGTLTFAPAQAADYHTVSSFDGTKITFYWFPAVGPRPGEKAPTVLQGPGFGGQAQSDPDAKGNTTTPGVADLRRAGYNVLTWNPRGIAPSGGKAMLDNPQFEGRDVSALIDWVASRPEAELDADNDPRVGMTGGSYGGAIQLATAGTDDRIDVIVPVIAWNSLQTSLYPRQTIKTAWVNALMTGASQPGRTFSESILIGRRQAARGTTFTPEVVRFARSAGPAQVVPDIKAPTLLIQGTVDNLFPPSEAIANYEALRKAGTPVKMIWFCGGHGVCLTKGAESTLPVEQARLWLRRYLNGDSNVEVGPGFTWIDQHGEFRSADTFPETTSTVRGTGSGKLTLRERGGSGPYTVDAPSGISPTTWLLVSRTVPTIAERAVDVPIRAGQDAVVVGAPTLHLRYRGKSKAKKVRVLAQLIDPRSRTVVGNQLTPVPLKLNGRKQQLSMPLEAISFRLKKKQRLVLQLVAQSSAFNTYPKGGQVRFSRISVSLPTVG